MGGACSTNGEDERVYVIGGKARGKEFVGGWIILGFILQRWDGLMWSGLVWLRIGTGGELL
jgi:hypothetical protein